MWQSTRDWEEKTLLKRILSTFVEFKKIPELFLLTENSVYMIIEVVNEVLQERTVGTNSTLWQCKNAFFSQFKRWKIGHHGTSQYSFGVNKLPHLNKKSSLLEKDAVQT